MCTSLAIGAIEIYLHAAECICIKIASLVRVSVPEYWTRVGGICFNFSGLGDDTGEDALGSISDYQWGLGDSPGAVNIIPLQAIERTSSRFSSFNIQSYVRLVTPMQTLQSTGE